MKLILVVVTGVLVLLGLLSAQEKPMATGPAPGAAAFKVPILWEYTAPLISPEKREKDPSAAQKDPSIVFHNGTWHVFMTVKLAGRTAIEYCSFARWEDADQAPRTVLKLSDSKYYAAPQVFYFVPHRMWYLIYQMAVPGVEKMWVAYSTTPNIAAPSSWTQAQPVLDGGAKDPRKEGGLDYWIICDDQRAYLFFTNLNGKLWRMWTKLEEFPKGFDHAEVALQGPFFEASHTYRLKSSGRYLTIIEENGQRYYTAYLANRLDSPWTPLADTVEQPFAGWRTIRPAKGVEPWTDNVSHGELIREGNDQTMTVDPEHLRFVFQGMREQEKAGKDYGQFPWRLGILSPVSGPATKK
jgi:hypothetical protein